MDKPRQFFSIHNVTGEIKEHIGQPSFHLLEEWEATDDLNVRRKINHWTTYEDTRYEARMRLYNYVSFTKRCLEMPRYKPFRNTEIGKSIPILNF